MTLISIRERGALNPGPVVCFDGGEEFPIAVADPFSPEEEERLAWYFEEHLRFPFTKDVRAEEAAASIPRYGEALFGQVFADRDAYARYRATTQAGLENLALEVAGSPEFQRLHWETLRDPLLRQPLALHAPLVRRNLKPQPLAAALHPSPTINLLLVTARPDRARDVGYRTISRPLVEGLRQAGLPVRVDILRPGTYRALVQRLEDAQRDHGSGHYHVVHFDVHGALMPYEALKKGASSSRYTYNPYGRDKIPEYQGLKAFLFMEGDKAGQADPVEAGQLADLLKIHQVPIVVLNACQSGMQVGAQETSLGSRLMEAGVQMALAMGYSVTVSAAELMMRVLYEQLFGGQELGAAICRARQELCNAKGRRAYFDRTIELEDWMLPVAYQNRAQRLATRPFTPAEHAAYYEGLAQRYRPPEMAYGFLGRDLDVLEIERRLLGQRNIMLLRGMGGAGKTSLLHHLAAWWQSTGLVNKAWYFGYDQSAWTRQQIMDRLAGDLMDPGEFHGLYRSLGEEARQALLAGRLRAERHLLILDNLESITATHLAIPNTLPAQEQARLRSFLSELRDGRTLVLLGSRGGEEWLAPGAFEDNAHELGGLDAEAASALADRVLERQGAAAYRGNPDLQQILKLLEGYPLAIEVVLANLARQAPAEVLAALRQGGEGIDSGAEDKTQSLLRCIDYAYGNLSPAAQRLLQCLAPFTSVVPVAMIEQYSEALRAQPALARLPTERWAEVLGEARNWGLLAPHAEMTGYLRMQPVLPYFLRARLAAPERAADRGAIEAAFGQFYDSVAETIDDLIRSHEASQRQQGQALAHMQYENLYSALDVALERQGSVLYPYHVLSLYLDNIQDQQRGLALGEKVLARLRGYAPQALDGPLGAEFVGVVDDIAKRQFLLNQYSAAEASYQQALSLHMGLTIHDERQKAVLSAGIYHQLGMVAQHQRRWAQAERYYLQALELLITTNSLYNQACTYHQLGMLAQEQRQWEQAERYYQKALDIFITTNDRYSQASPYHQLARVAEEQRQWEKAERYYQQALEICIAFDDRHDQARIYNGLGRVAQEQQQREQAERYYQQALEIYITFDDRYSQAGTYHQLGMLAQEQRQWAQAERYYQQALEIKIAFDDRHSQASTYHQLGMLAQEQRQWQQAERYYQQALEIYIAFDDRYSQASTYHQLGRVAQEQRQWAQAERYYQQALEIYIAFDDRYNQASTYHQLGMLAQEQQQWEQAREHLLRALGIYHEDEDADELAITAHRLARLWRKSGDATLPAAVATALGAPPEQGRAFLLAMLMLGKGAGAGSPEP